MTQISVRTAALFLAGALVLAWLAAAPALSRPAGAGGAPVLTVAVDRQQKGSTNSPDTDLWEFALRVTNQGGAVVQFSNNSFLLEDSAGVRHRVARPWYRQTLALQPGESTVVDRIYFEIPKSARPARIAVMQGKRVLGMANL